MEEKQRRFSWRQIVFCILVLFIIARGGFLLKKKFLPKKIRHVILISIDTCRADYLSCYGYPEKTTPNIDAVASEGVLFKHVVSSVPITLAAHSTMLTGTIPPYHKVHDNNNYKLGESNVTLAEILKDNGFVTGAVVGAFVLDSQFGISQGFDTYHDYFSEKPEDVYYDNERKAEEVSEFGIKWLEEHRDEKGFLFLHYFDPHHEYKPPEPFLSEFKSNLYAGEIAYTDYCVGKVIEKLKELDIYDSSLIIITSDHGEGLGEHSESTHSLFIYHSTIRVPLIIKIPQGPEGKVIDGVVGLVDILPTVCAVLDIEIPFLCSR